MSQKECLIYFDGGARGNGTSSSTCGAGFVIKDTSGETLYAGQRYLANLKTNNEAEYTGLEEALKLAHDKGFTKAKVRGDSLLVINQMKGDWKVKASNIAKHHSAVKDLAKKFTAGVVFEHVRRDLNSEADKYANLAMDAKKSQNISFNK